MDSTYSNIYSIYVRYLYMVLDLSSIGTCTGDVEYLGSFITGSNRVDPSQKGIDAYRRPYTYNAPTIFVCTWFGPHNNC
jgi:hypothetical protein